jgi:hypothetical protein
MPANWRERLPFIVSTAALVPLHRGVDGLDGL